MFKLKVKDKDNGAPSREIGNDPSGLLDSVRKIVREQVDDIKRASESEMARMRNAAHDEIELFREAEKAKLEEFIEAERSKIINRASIEKKKIFLDVMESYISGMIAGAADLFKRTDGYEKFLTGAAAGAVEELKSSEIEIRLHPDDMNIRESIHAALQNSGFTGSSRFTADPGIKNGGIIVTDLKSEIVVNRSIDRVIYRKRDIIRKEIAGLLRESGSANG